MIKAVFFDLDETLVDVSHFHEQATRDAFAHFGFNYEEIKKKSPHHISRGKRIADNIRVRINAAKIPEEQLPFNKLIAFRESLFLSFVSQSAPLLPGAINALNYCAVHQITVAIVSSGSAQYINLIVKKYSLENIIDFIVSGEDVAEGKPSPECYEKAFLLLQDKTITKKDCLVVEDSEAGVRSGQEAGIPTLLVNRDAAAKNLLSPDYYIATLEDFEKVIHL